MGIYPYPGSGTLQRYNSANSGRNKMSGFVTILGVICCKCANARGIAQCKSASPLSTAFAALGEVVNRVIDELSRCDCNR